MKVGSVAAGAARQCAPAAVIGRRHAAPQLTVSGHTSCSRTAPLSPVHYSNAASGFTRGASAADVSDFSMLAAPATARLGSPPRRFLALSSISTSGQTRRPTHCSVMCVHKGLTRCNANLISSRLEGHKRGRVVGSRCRGWRTSRSRNPPYGSLAGGGCRTGCGHRHSRPKKAPQVSLFA